MADLLIKHLQEKGSQHSSLALLVNQWGFDEQLIPKALQTIGGLFPHYSRHDESHSKQILVNIERLLGENIHLLTATDTWLILEAAYWHDIGMVVPKKDMEEAIADEKFGHYLIEIKNDHHHDLHKFAMNFDPSDLMKCFVGADSPVDAIDKFRQLMAEWFRRQHTIRSDNTIRSPWEQIGLSSPRTELIPKRLFNTLGRICALHGANFSEITSDSVLPFREAGLGQEDCHPRFVACLLRLGDLLDLDNNRFCPVMQRIAGDDRPNLSKAHEDKHISIQHFRLDRDKIEVTAECETIPGYIETYKWFEWLKQEIQDQVSNWMAIVPNRELGLLPTLGNIYVKLKGEHQIITPGKRPEFTVDSSNVMNLLQGNNLYNTKFACIRELLQNAIDSTLIKIWLTDVPENNKINWNNPLLENIQEELSRHHVLFSIEQNNSVGYFDDKINVWDVTIIDQGTGISLEDLMYMMKIGGSRNNIYRQRIIESMPEWLKPSGNFGIGFQSVFLITDEISITTKNIKNGMILEITMQSPSSKNQGLVLVKELPHNFSQPYGTQVKFTIKTPRFSDRWTVSLDRKPTMVKDFLSTLDPVLNDDFPFEIAQMADHVTNFSEHSLLPIKASLKTNEISREIPCIREPNEDKKSWKFVTGKGNAGDEYQIIIKWLPLYGRGESICFYRGQQIEAKNIGVNNCFIWIDILSGKASTWLTASRDKLRKDAEDRLYDIILDALLKVVTIDIEKNKNDQKFLQDASLFLAGFSTHDEKWKLLYEKTSTAWLDIIILGQSKSFRDLLNEGNLTVGHASINGTRNLSILKIRNHIDFESEYILELFIAEWLKRCKASIEINTRAELDLSHKNEDNHLHVYLTESDLCYKLNNNSEEEIKLKYSDRALANLLISGRNMSINRRYLLMVFGDQWKKLILKSDIKIRAMKLFEFSLPEQDYILIPFLYKSNYFQENKAIECTAEQLSDLCKWIKPRLKENLSTSEIRKEYTSMIKYLDDLVMSFDDFKESWKTKRKLDM